MSPAQKTLYWRLWSRLSKTLGWHTLPSTTRDTLRRQLHTQAGCPPSSKDFNNRHLDRYITYTNALIHDHNDPGTPRTDDDGHRRRLIWRIQTDATLANLDEAYIRHLARDLHVLGNWQDLDLESLENLRNTIHNRATTKLGHDPRTHPTNPDNEPF
jgi:hypothetical protein